MNNYIKNVKIANLFGEKNVDWNLNKVNVLVGKNGLGKSTILNLINTTVNKTSDPIFGLCDRVDVNINDGSTFTASRELLNYDDIALIIEFLNSNSPIKVTDEKNVASSELSQPVRANLINALETITSDYNEGSINEIIIPSYKFGPNKTTFRTEFISTINMSANSVNRIIKSTGEHTTLLDLEIESEIKRLTDNISKNTEKELGSKFEDALNNFFIETGKKVQFIDDQLIITLESGKSLSFKHLSSGERQIIFIFLKVINGSVDRSLILMDEPEISLHLSWQEKLLDEITKVNDVSQIIIVTHSPAIVMNGWFDCLTDIDSIFTKNINNVEAT